MIWWRRRLGDLARLDDAAFRALFSGSPVKRVGRDRFIRNVLIAIGNSGDSELINIVGPLLADASPLVRAMAVWAIAQLTTGDQLSGFRDAHLADEADADVRAEWGTA